MRTLGLKTQMIKEDVQILLDAGLFEQVDEPDEGVYVYKTTKKGLAALEQFYKMVTQFFIEPKKVGMFLLV